MLSRLHQREIAQVHFAPLIVAGDHAPNDLAGEGEDSWKSRLESEGYQVQTHLYGLGELDAVGDIFVDHCRRAVMTGRREGRKNRNGISSLFFCALFPPHRIKYAKILLPSFYFPAKPANCLGYTEARGT